MMLKEIINYFSNACFPYCFSEWNKLGRELRNATSSFKNSLLVVIRPKSRTVLNIVNPIGLKFIVRLRLNLGYIRKHKFRRNFLDTINPICSCRIGRHSLIILLKSISNLSEDKLTTVIWK